MVVLRSGLLSAPACSYFGRIKFTLFIKTIHFKGNHPRRLLVIIIYFPGFFCGNYNHTSAGLATIYRRPMGTEEYFNILNIGGINFVKYLTITKYRRAVNYYQHII